MFKIALSAIIAALYCGLTVALAPISFGPLQFRVAEAMTVLPFIIPEAVPGLFIGCALANIFGGFGIIDIILGSFATLLAAWFSRRMPTVWLAALPPVAINAIIVGAYLAILTETPIYLSLTYIALSQSVICFGLGIPLCKFVMKFLSSNKGFNDI